jgi:glycosyltransferase involved in cell wall biosynthesis
MRILHVIANLAPRYGGPTKVCEEICRALAQAGDKVTVYTTNLNFPSGKLDVPVNVAVDQDYFHVWYFPVQFSPYVASLDMARALYRHIKKFDLVHIHGLYRFPQTIAAYYARRFSVPYVVSPHGSLDPFLFNRPKNRLAKRIYEHLVEFPNLNNAAAIHFTSEEEMRLTQTLGLKAPGIVVPVALEPTDYENLPEQGKFREQYQLGDRKIILFLGRINFKKGLDILVRAFAQVARTREDVCLVLAGPDNEGYGNQVECWLVQEGVRSQAIFTGMLQGVDKLAALKDADFFALPSYSENFGIAVVEAMASGLPVVISDKVNIWQEVQNTGAGLVTPCDVNEVSKAFLILLDDGNTRRKMGEAGKALVSTKYAWTQVVKELQESYRSIVDKACCRDIQVKG